MEATNWANYPDITILGVGVDNMGTGSMTGIDGEKSTDFYAETRKTVTGLIKDCTAKTTNWIFRLA